MVDIVENSKIIGGDLPNIYIDRINIYDKNIDLDISHFEKQISTKFSKNKFSDVSFRFFQITDKNIFNILKNISLIRLLNIKENETVKILDVDFSDNKKIKHFRTNTELNKKSQTITFNISSSKIQNLYYLAVPYFYESDQSKLALSNANSFPNKTSEIVIENGKLNKTIQEYVFVKDDTKWYGDVVLLNNRYFTVEKIRRPLSAREIENNKIKDYRTLEERNIVLENPGNVPNKELRNLKKYNSLGAKQNYSNFITAVPALKPERTLKTENTNKTVTITFTVDLKKVLFDTFLNKKYFNDNMFNFLKDSLVEKQIKLYKKIIANKNTAINTINTNQKDILCADSYTFTDLGEQNSSEYLRSYTMSDNNNSSDIKNKYVYFVELTYDNLCAKKILEQIKSLNDELPKLTELTQSKQTYRGKNGNLQAKRSRSVNIQTETNDTTRIANKFINLHCIMNNCSKNERIELEQKIYNLISPNSLTVYSLSMFEKMYNNLTNQYNELYRSMSGKSFINLSPDPNSNNVVAKTSLITIRKDIVRDVQEPVQKIDTTINYLSNITDGSITLENLINRIKQEKQRLFETENSSLYSTEYMFSYLSPESFNIGDEIYNLNSLQSQKNNNSLELLLNGSVSKMKRISQIQVNNIKQPATTKQIDNDQNVKIELYNTTLSNLSNKYGFTIKENNIKNLNPTSKVNNDVEFYKQSKIVKKIDKINKIVDFNNNFNVNIPTNIINLPNQLIKAREKSSKFNKYKEIFDYSLLIQLEIYVNDRWILLTKSSILDFVKTNTSEVVRCRMIEYMYDFNKKLKYDVSRFAKTKLETFEIRIDRNTAEQLIQNV